MKQYIQNFKKFQPLLEELVARDIKIKYRRSVLGVLWTLLNPLLMMIVLSVVFSNLFKFDVENFPLFILSGQVIFNFFSESTTNSGYGCDKSGIALDSNPCSDSIGIVSNILYGNWTDSFGNCCKVQRYHAFILCIHYSTDVSDTDYLSNVNFTGMAETNRKFESNYQYPADVQRCDVGLYNL